MKKKLIWLLGILGILSIALVVFNATRTYTSKFTGPVSVDDPLPAEMCLIWKSMSNTQ
jgi:hypothetical protein